MTAAKMSALQRESRFAGPEICIENGCTVHVVQLDIRNGIAAVCSAGIGAPGVPEIVGMRVRLVSMFYTLHHLTSSETELLLAAVANALAIGGVVAIAALVATVSTPQLCAEQLAAPVPASSLPPTDVENRTSTCTVAPLDPVLCGLYRSFAKPTVLARMLEKHGVSVVHMTTRASKYPNEFPSDRCYVIGVKGV
jgi:hypothetical protein